MRPPSSFAPTVLPAVALVSSFVRWYTQGSYNLYTAFEKRFYVPDPDLGWRISKQHPIWLGLDVCAVIAALVVAVAIGGVVVRRRIRAPVLRAITWIVAALPMTVPALAFASGPGPLHGRETLPPRAAVLVEDGIEGSIDAPAGRYVVVAHDGTSITAHLSAGGEAFDARFAGDLDGSWQGDPRDLAGPMRAELSVAAASVDTGVGERSKHAREGYLHADQFPRITVTMNRLAAVRADAPDALAFRAPGTVQLVGKTHAVAIDGIFRKLDGAALARLGLTGDVLLVQADFALVIRETALATHAGDFDGDRIPIHVSLVLRHTAD